MPLKTAQLFLDFICLSKLSNSLPNRYFQMALIAIGFDRPGRFEIWQPCPDLNDRSMTVRRLLTAAATSDNLAHIKLRCRNLIQQSSRLVYIIKSRLELLFIYSCNATILLTVLPASIQCGRRPRDQSPGLHYLYLPQECETFVYIRACIRLVHLRQGVKMGNNQR